MRRRRKRHEILAGTVQVSTGSKAVEYLSFLRNILSPFLESYWHTALALLQMETDTEGTPPSIITA